MKSYNNDKSANAAFDDGTDSGTMFEEKEYATSSRCETLEKGEELEKRELDSVKETRREDMEDDDDDDDGEDLDIEAAHVWFILAMPLIYADNPEANHRP